MTTNEPVSVPTTRRLMRPGLALALLAGAIVAICVGTRAWLLPDRLEVALRAYAQGDWKEAEMQARARLKVQTRGPARDPTRRPQCRVAGPG